MRRSYKYRIYPNKIQGEALDHIFNFCRFLYNSALQERISYYKKYGKTFGYNRQAAELKEIKDLFAEQTKSIYSQTLRQVLKRLDISYQNFFRKIRQNKSGKKGFPRYKSVESSASICFPRCNLITGGIKMIGDKIKVFGISDPIRIKLHRPFQGRCKQVTIKKQSDKYYLILSCDDVPVEILEKTGKIVAIDLGLISFITTDDGSKIHHPKPYRTAKEKLALANQKLARKKRGSNNRKRAKRSLARLYEKVSNIRNDFQHKTANNLIAENDLIIVEKLNIKNMMEAEGFQISKSNITDAAWGSFIALLSYKAESAGKKLIMIDPKNTSRICSCCGSIKKNLQLSDRIYNCEACGFQMDRDRNAARNILRLGTSLAISQTLRV